jgi:hypothetical protein
VAARGAWLSRAAPVAGRVYARWAMFLGLGSRGLTRRPFLSVKLMARFLAKGIASLLFLSTFQSIKLQF